MLIDDNVVQQQQQYHRINYTTFGIYLNKAKTLHYNKNVIKFSEFA